MPFRVQGQGHECSKPMLTPGHAFLRPRVVEVKDKAKVRPLGGHGQGYGRFETKARSFRG